MAKYTQDDRPMRVDSVLAPDTLLLDSFHGIEAVSSPFAFHIDLLSEKPDIDTHAMLRTPMRLAFKLPDDKLRYVHGLVRRFVQLGQEDDLTRYHAEIVPWFWFLSLSRECRIYQHMTPLQIIEQVFRDHGYSDYKFDVKHPPPQREYVVQYRETHLNFVSRLMEEEGIFYFFEHEHSKHTMVITNHNGAAPANTIPPARFHRQQLNTEDLVTSLEREYLLHAGTVTLRDYDYLQPQLTLENQVAGEYREEIYDYPGGYTQPSDGDRYARLQLEALEATHHIVRGESRCRTFVSGYPFELQEHYRPDTNQEYLLLRVQHFMQGGSYRSGETQRLDYRNDFLAIPLKTPFRPQRRTPKPVIHGTQTAIVVGPAGEEVYTDKYGRVKVQFYWDRLGNRDEKSSCWVRVASPWAGKGWGNVTIPRIDNEVVVEFLEGDPDRPLIVGSVYNAEQMPPFALPSSGIQMGMKSRSSKGGGGYNEITMTDTKGKEQITIHAQYDMSTTVEHNQTSLIRNDRSVTVDGKCSNTTKNDHSLTVTEGNYTHKVDTGKADITVKQDITTHSTAGAISETAQNDFSITSSTAAIKITAATSITILVGSSSIQMGKDGKITIKGKSIMIDGSDDVTIQGAKIQATGKQEVKVGVGSNQMTCNTTQVNVSGAAIASSAVGTHSIAGAVVKIN